MNRSGPPVFVFATDGEVRAFAHLEDAATWMEAADVLEGEYEAAYTLDGRIVGVSAEWDGPVSLQLGDAYDPEDLAERLSRSGRSMGLDFDLSDLRSAVNQLLRWEWERRWPRWPRSLSRVLGRGGPEQV